MDRTIIGFEYDNALCVGWSSTPRPGIYDAIQRLHAQNTRYFVIAHQAGPWWRARTGLSNFPDITTVAWTMALGITATGMQSPFICVAIAPRPGHLAEDGGRTPTLPIVDGLHHALAGWLPSATIWISDDSRWRKPQGGMIHDALNELGVELEQRHLTLFIGNSTDDAGAAQAAGMPYQHVDAWLESLR